MIALPLKLGDELLPATTRASFYLYTTTDEIDALIRGVERVRKVFA